MPRRPGHREGEVFADWDGESSLREGLQRGPGIRIGEYREKMASNLVGPEVKRPGKKRCQYLPFLFHGSHRITACSRSNLPKSAQRDEVISERWTNWAKRQDWKFSQANALWSSTDHQLMENSKQMRTHSPLPLCVIQAERRVVKRWAGWTWGLSLLAVKQQSSIAHL